MPVTRKYKRRSKNKNKNRRTIGYKQKKTLNKYNKCCTCKGRTKHYDRTKNIMTTKEEAEKEFTKLYNIFVTSNDGRVLSCGIWCSL
jgi:hypothetical protein